MVLPQDEKIPVDENPLDNYGHDEFICLSKTKDNLPFDAANNIPDRLLQAAQIYAVNNDAIFDFTNRVLFFYKN